jgi:hypothetical protein
MSRSVFSKTCFFALFAATVFSTTHAAEEGEGDKAEYRYQFERIDGKLYRLDRRTGQVHLVVIGRDGIKRMHSVEAVFQPVSAGSETKATPQTQMKSENVEKLSAPAQTKNTGPEIIVDGEEEPAEVKSGPKKTAATPAIFNPTPEDRRKTEALILAHSRDLSVSTAVQEVGDRLKVMLIVSNKGPRKIAAVEITVAVPTLNGERTEEHRRLLADRPGLIAPPEPTTAERVSVPAIVNFDLPAPPGGRKGSVTARVTYLAFADDDEVLER